MMTLTQILECIAQEDELPGPMPDEMATILRDAFEQNDLDLLAEAFRITVRQTKAGIADRVKARYWEEE